MMKSLYLILAASAFYLTYKFLKQNDKIRVCQVVKQVSGGHLIKTFARRQGELLVVRKTIVHSCNIDEIKKSDYNQVLQMLTTKTNLTAA